MSSPYGKWKWWATKNPNRRAHLGIFDAPTPWGPWSVVDYIADWGAPENRFAPNIPSKWISDDGTTFYLLYSCIPNGPLSIQYPTLHGETETDHDGNQEVRHVYEKTLQPSRRPCSSRFFGSVACDAEEHVVFSQPKVSDISDRLYIVD